MDIRRISTHASRKTTLRLRAEITRLNSGLEPQQDLLRRAEQARGSIETDSRAGSTTRDSLKVQSEDLRKKAATADGADADALKKQLLDTQNRIAQLEKEAGSRRPLSRSTDQAFVCCTS